MSEVCKIFYEKDVERENVAKMLQKIKEVNRKLHDFITENLRKDNSAGIREDVLVYLGENISKFREDQEFTYVISSLICNMKISAEHLNWVNEYFSTDAGIGMSDFMVVLGEAVEKDIPLNVIKKLFEGAEDEVAVYRKVVEYVPVQESDMLHTDQEIENVLPKQITEEESKQPAVSETNNGMTEVFDNLLTIMTLRNKEQNNSAFEVQNCLNRVIAEIQTSLSQLSGFSTDMVREWEKDKEQIQRLTAFNEILRKIIESNQKSMDRLRSENIDLQQKLQALERSEIQQQTIRQKVAELDELTSRFIPSPEKSSLSSISDPY